MPTPSQPAVAATAPVHVLMRFSDKLFGIGNVIERHQRVLHDEGSVWIAKLGRPLGPSRMAQLNDQVADGIRTDLILTQNVNQHHELWRANIVEVQPRISAGDQHAAPEYYNDIGIMGSTGSWIKVDSIEPMTQSDRDRYFTVSSKRPIIRTLTSSMASLFIVREGLPDVGDE